METIASQTIKQITTASLQLGGVTINPYVVVKGLLAIALLLWVVGLAMRLIDRRLRRISGMRTSTRVLIMKIVHISFYFLVFISGMQMMGINLTALSVFSGALGVGLGFGLQKIASNFISGIILLFEKSIEVGDVLELADGTVGTVRLTRARFTQIETQDGREIFIPNEEFISQRVTNWTHSDKHARVDIPITVAYDSDFSLARRLMLEAADRHPKRVSNRPSLCVLHAFRDSGVEIHLYFWIADIVDGRMEPKSEVMQEILRSFRQHQITIPYPQRELRVTNLTPSEAVIVTAGAA